MTNDDLRDLILEFFAELEREHGVSATNGQLASALAERLTRLGGAAFAAASLEELASILRKNEARIHGGIQ